jgi:hypothetical protein
MTETAKTYRTKTGRVLTDADVECLADEVAGTEYKVERMHDQTRKA